MFMANMYSGKLRKRQGIDDTVRLGGCETLVIRENLCHSWHGLLHSIGVLIASFNDFATNYTNGLVLAENY
jgi:hypothetical protein